jgi:hypothetical protein
LIRCDCVVEIDRGELYLVGCDVFVEAYDTFCEIFLEVLFTVKKKTLEK